ncbi:polysaccharide biosynthesis C-terminal domain-containing protein, partial [Clostridioides difficile]|uniref:polysaccharide biosynthesis C-terminal domain-containing protein n=1 Tax=Clostridioides difficile TaxID=1496 RepID=UPI002A91D891
IYLFKGYGLSIATIICTMFTTIIAYRFLSRKFDINPIKYNRKYYSRLVYSTIVMTILSLLMLKIISSVYKFESTLQLFFLIILIGCLGGVVFSVTLFRNKFISKLGKLF